MMWGYDWSWGWGGLVMMGMMVLFWVFVVAVGVWLATSLGRTGGGTAAPDRGAARRILDERLARGEIDADEYRTKLGLLEGSR